MTCCGVTLTRSVPSTTSPFLAKNTQLDLSDFLFQDIVGFGDNDRGVSFTFGANEVSKFLKRNNLSLIARAHQVKT